MVVIMNRKQIQKLAVGVIILIILLIILSWVSTTQTNAATKLERAKFFEKIVPLVQLDMKQNHILASFTIAQACMETGYGTSQLCIKGNNLFGIMAPPTWTGKVYNSSTGKVYSSYAKAHKYSGRLWKAYDSWEESIADHSKLFNTSERYSKLRANYNFKSCANILVTSGYTKMNHWSYRDELLWVYKTFNLAQYDVFDRPEQISGSKSAKSDEIFGDVNGDGAKNNSDLYFLKQYFLGGYTPSQSEAKYCDINGDNRVSIIDYFILKRALAQ